MTTNAPSFDPIKASPEEEAEMVAGYLAAWRGEARPDLASVAFEHGYRMARNDRAGVVDADQPELARRFLEKQRKARSTHQDAPAA
jgi:hypothetical protein